MTNSQPCSEIPSGAVGAGSSKVGRHRRCAYVVIVVLRGGAAVSASRRQAGRRTAEP
jgi:hypothetical protein